METGVCANRHFVACPSQTNSSAQASYSGTHDYDFHDHCLLGTDKAGYCAVTSRDFVHQDQPNLPRSSSQCLPLLETAFAVTI